MFLNLCKLTITGTPDIVYWQQAALIKKIWYKKEEDFKK